MSLSAIASRRYQESNEPPSMYSGKVNIEQCWAERAENEAKGVSLDGHDASRRLEELQYSSGEYSCAITITGAAIRKQIASRQASRTNKSAIRGSSLPISLMATGSPRNVPL